METRPLLIFTDPGIDDFIALSMLLRDPAFEVCGIVSLSGNVGLDVTVNNALLCAELNGRADVPVLAGSAKPLCRPARTAAYIHGRSGLGKHVEEYTSLTPCREDAVEFTARMVKKYAGRLELVSLGPLTDVARALQKYPELIPQVADVLIMGGGVHRGNATKYAEFNIVADPEAAAFVFSCGVHVTMVGLDATHECVLPRSSIPQPGKSRLGRIVPAMLHDYADVYKTVHNLEGMVIHDAICVLLLSHPEYFRCEDCPMHICLDEGEHLGQTVVDKTGPKNCTAALDANTEQVNACLTSFICDLAR